MKIKTKTTSDVEVLEVKGEIDLHSSPQIREKTNPLFTKKTPKILFDLKEVTYIDSSGLATFIETLQRVNQYGGKLIG